MTWLRIWLGGGGGGGVYWTEMLVVVWLRMLMTWGGLVGVVGMVGTGGRGGDPGELLRSSSSVLFPTGVPGGPSRSTGRMGETSGLYPDDLGSCLTRVLGAWRGGW